jgi:hypothetical protein
MKSCDLHHGVPSPKWGTFLKRTVHPINSRLVRDLFSIAACRRQNSLYLGVKEDSRTPFTGRVRENRRTNVC